MPAHDERVPRKRTSHKNNDARVSRRGCAQERGQAPERKPASGRGRPQERERVAQRGRPQERERVARRERPQERERVARRERPQERERVARRERPQERERVAQRQRPQEREYRRTPRRKAAPVRERAANRRRPPKSRRRQAPLAGLSAFLTRAAVMVLILFAVGKLGSPFFIQELQVNRVDSPAPYQKAQTAPSDKTPLAPNRIAAVSDIAAVAPDNASGNVAEQERKDGFYTILLAGTDDHNGGSDTVILVSVDSKNHRIFGVSVPRDTKAIVKDKAHKINAAYKVGGMSLLSETVSSQMSIPIDYTVEVDLNGFAALVDAVGGVDFDVPLDMDYEDPKQNLEIHISKGPQHLNGENALKVVRFRHNSDGSGYPDQDLGRIRTQQNFLKTAAKSLLTFSSLTKLDDFARIFQMYVKTDLTLQNLVWLGKQAFEAGSDGIQFATLLGTWKSPFVYTNREEALTLINEHLNPYKEDRTREDLNFPS